MKLKTFLNIISIFSLNLILLFCFYIHSISYVNITIYIMSVLSLISSIICIFLLINTHVPSFGHTFVLLLYTVLTQFGANITFYLFPSVTNYNQMNNNYHYMWLRSEYLVKAINIGIIAIIVLVLTSIFINYCKYLMKFNKNHRIHLRRSDNLGLVIIGFLLLFISFLYFIINIVTGRILLTGSYIDFMGFTKNNILYSYILIALATGFIFIIACGNKKEIKLCIILYCIISVFLLLTGNKGEVYYAALAAVGVFYTRFKKINKNVLLFGIASIFLIIPLVTNTRVDGVLNSVSEMEFDITDSFIEMGFQLRVSEKMIRLIDDGRPLLYGFSYYNPIVNILNRLFPIIPRLTAPPYFDFSEQFDTMGFTQVAESYANFGLLGVVIFHILIGAMLGQFDSNQNDSKRALYGAFMVLFIIMTRNSFSFVFGQMLIIFVFYIIGKLIGRYMTGRL